jgi:hypothetical protein
MSIEADGAMRTSLTSSSAPTAVPGTQRDHLFCMLFEYVCHYAVDRVFDVDNCGGDFTINVGIFLVSSYVCFVCSFVVCVCVCVCVCV